MPVARTPCLVEFTQSSRFLMSESQKIAEKLHSQLRDPAKKHLWASLPCTSGCPWHRVGLALNGAEYRKRHAKEVAASRALFKQFREQAETALSHGHDVTFEWPRYSNSVRIRISSKTPVSCRLSSTVVGLVFVMIRVGRSRSPDAS